MRQKKTIEDWRKEYNTFRPHGSLSGLTPEEFRKAWKNKKNNKRHQKLNLQAVQCKG
jgi:hypothetical protein